MTLGERIRQRRKELGLTQLELGERMGYTTRAAICNIEKDKEDLTTARIRRLAEALETSPAHLMGWDEQIQQVQDQIEPFAKRMTEYSKKINESIQHEFTLDNGLIVELEKMEKTYTTKQLLRAMKFVEAFLNAPPSTQKVALEVLKLNQSDT